MRWIVLVRTGSLLLGAAAIVMAVLWSIGPFQTTEGYRHASFCPGGVPTPASAAHDCVALEIATVTGRSTYDESTSDGDGGSSTMTYYVVTYRRASGALESKDVLEPLYDVATTGRQADLQTWRGAVVRITVADQSNGFDPPTEGFLVYTAVLAWAGLGLILWFLLGDGTLRQLVGSMGMRALGWLGFGLGTSFAVHHVLTYAMSTSDYVWGSIFEVVGALFALGFVLVGLGDSDGAESLVSVAWDHRPKRGQ